MEKTVTEEASGPTPAGAAQEPAGLDMMPLTPGFGMSVRGFDFSVDVPAEKKDRLRRALFDHQILVFPGQTLDEDDQARFAGIFGPCRPLWQNRHYQSSNPLTHYLSNVTREGQPIGRHPDPDSALWHSDGSWARTPSVATVLYAVDVPEASGPTHFANMYAVYDGLPDRDKERLGRLGAEHHAELSRSGRDGRLPWQWGKGRKQISVISHLRWWAGTFRKRWQEGPVIHPVVRPHPQTGRKALFIGDHAWRIAGRPWPSGIKEMRALNAMAIPEQAQYTHRWKKGDLVIWDNGSLLHRVGDYDLNGETRIMRRSVVEAEGTG